MFLLPEVKDTKWLAVDLDRDRVCHHRKAYLCGKGE